MSQIRNYLFHKHLINQLRFQNIEPIIKIRPQIVVSEFVSLGKAVEVFRHG